MYGVASIVAECLALFFLFASAFLVWLQAFSKLRSDAPRVIYSDVTQVGLPKLPNLSF